MLKNDAKTPRTFNITDRNKWKCDSFFQSSVMNVYYQL